ncbi:MAG: hypothetical protein Q9160_007995 [Pyrenula sp. 1 TL-2023]
MAPKQEYDHGSQGNREKLIIAVCGGIEWNLVSIAPRLPSQGETLTSNSLTQLPGGKGANVAIALYRLTHVRPAFEADNASQPPPENAYRDLGLPEFDIRLVGSVGQRDDFGYGERMKQLLKNQHINVDRVIEQPDYESAVSVTWVEAKSGENRTLVNPGASHAMKPEEFQNPDECFGPSRPDLLVSQLELHRETVQKLLRTAKMAGIDTLFNPCPADGLDDLSVYKGLTHLVLNETEAAIMSGREELALDFDDWDSITDVFIERGTEHVVITLGSRGAFYSEKKGHGSLVEAVKVPQRKILNTSGAGYVFTLDRGFSMNSFSQFFARSQSYFPLLTTISRDAFVGAYAIQWVKQKRQGWDIRSAVECACKVSAQVIQGLGYQESIPWASDLR